MVGGAAPQVLAHSATTRNFEITDEIEVKDDLDNKPDECSEGASEKALNLLNRDFLSAGIIDLVSDLDALRKIEKFSWTDDFNYRIVRIVSWGGRARSTIGGSGTQWTQVAVSDGVESISSVCPWTGCEFYQFDNEFDALATESTTEVGYDGKSLTVSITIPQRNDAEARDLAAIYSEALKIGACSDIYATPPQQAVYKHSVSKPGNGQVLIITRLPRAGLDAMLAKDAK